jgi:hypothetical protein
MDWKSEIAENQMVKYDKLLLKILRGVSDNNIAFEDLRNLLLKLGFEERKKRKPSHIQKNRG